MAAVGLRASFNEKTLPELGPQCLDAKASLLACWDMLMDRVVNKDFSTQDTHTFNGKLYVEFVQISQYECQRLQLSGTLSKAFAEQALFLQPKQI